jgi:hypothetical protein
MYISGMWRLVVLAVVVLLATPACGRTPSYQVVVGDFDEDIYVASLAWTDPQTVYYLTGSNSGSDAPPNLWVSSGGQQRLLYSVRESHLRWDKECPGPYLFALAARDADSVVALVDCSGDQGRRIVSIRDDGGVTSLGPAPTGHILDWQRGTENGAAVIGPYDCRTVAPIAAGTITDWSSPAPPWNLNDLTDRSTCDFRGTIGQVGVSGDGQVYFVADDSLYTVSSNGGDVHKLAGGFGNVRDIAVAGPDIVLSADRGGQSGLWRWVRAKGSVDLFADGLFLGVAAAPDGAAIIAFRAGSARQIVRFDLA